jgi:RNA-binding protein NOB1
MSSYKDVLLQASNEPTTPAEIPTDASAPAEIPASVEDSSTAPESTKSTIVTTAKVDHLILDAGPLITQTYSEIKSFANKFYTTPAVYAEIRDERSRRNLELWGSNLIVRQPSAANSKAIIELAKKTGDYSVLSITDMQLLALCREIDIEAHGGSNAHLKTVASSASGAANLSLRITSNVGIERTTVGELDLSDKHEEENVDADGWAVVVPNKKKNRRFNKQNKEEKHEPEHKPAEPVAVETPSAAAEQKDEIQEQTSTQVEEQKSSAASEEILKSADAPTEQPADEVPESTQTEYIFEEGEDDDEEGWITNENLEENLIKEHGEINDKEDNETLPTAVSTGDFAMQNVALQMGLNLVNPSNGRHITQVKSFMLRCHACFKLTPFPRDGSVRQFCPSCGNNTLMRCTVSVSDAGQIHVFLKRRMQWTTRGNKYSIPNPQSKAARRMNRNEMLSAQSAILLREDQKEYGRAIKHDNWKKRQNEKLLNEWIGPVNGHESVDSVTSPFAISGYKRDAARHTGVRVGAGRYVNSVKRKTK